MSIKTKRTAFYKIFKVSEHTFSPYNDMEFEDVEDAHAYIDKEAEANPIIRADVLTYTVLPVYRFEILKPFYHHS